MRLRIFGCLLLAVTACTSEGGPRATSPAPTPRATATASASPSASPASPSPASPSPSAPASPAPGSLLLAVADKRGGLALYAVARGSHAATLVRRLEGPSGMAVQSVSLAAGPKPAVCALWRSPPSESSEATDALHCYAAETGRGRQVASEALHVAVRADGRAVAWTEYTPTALVVADLAGDTTTERRRDEGEPLSGLGQVAWLGPHTLVATDVADSDEGEGVCVIDTARPRGNRRCLQPGPEERRKGYERFEDAAPAENGYVITVERARWCCIQGAPKPPARAARVRLSDGKVVGVVATARTGRDVVDVSGGPRAVLYTTAAEGRDLVVSLRWAGDARGAPVTGLPADLLLAAAQP